MTTEESDAAYEAVDRLFRSLAGYAGVPGHRVERALTGLARALVREVLEGRTTRENLDVFASDEEVAEFFTEWLRRREVRREARQLNARSESRREGEEHGSEESE